MPINQISNENTMGKENKFEKRFAELFFEGTLNENEKIVQKDTNNVERTLVPFKLEHWDTTTRFYYILYERNNFDSTSIFEYIIAQNPIESTENIFNIPFNDKGYYFKDDNNKKKSLIAKYKNGFADAGFQLKYVLPIQTPQAICIDWYEVWYNLDTGEVYDEIYLYTQCYTSGDGGGGGGSMPPTVPTTYSVETNSSNTEYDSGPADGS